MPRQRLKAWVDFNETLQTDLWAQILGRVRLWVKLLKPFQNSGSFKYERTICLKRLSIFDNHHTDQKLVKSSTACAQF